LGIFALACSLRFNVALAHPLSPENSPKDSIIIGVSMGAATPSGVSSVRSMRMAVEEINTAGGVGGKNLILSVRYGKDKDAANMDSTIHELIREGAVCIVSGSGSANTLRAAHIAVAQGVMLMTAASTSPRISKVADKNLVWRTIPSDIFQAHVAADVLFKKKLKSVGIIAINNAYGSALAQAFTKTFEKVGGKVRASVSYPDIASYDTFSFKAKLDSLYAKKPAAIYVISYDNDGGKILSDSKGYFNADYKPFLFGCDGNYNNDFAIAVEPSLIEGMEGLSYVHPAKYANYDTFAAKFKEYSQRSADMSDLANSTLANMLEAESTNSYAATSYDAIYTFALAALKANSTKPADIAKQMPVISRATKGAVVVNVGEFAKASALIKQGKAINYEGASGPVDFDAKGDVSHGNYVIWRITGGKFIEAGTVAFP
jgi:branched-chain amino acid transport system substrate-binding protein